MQSILSVYLLIQVIVIHNCQYCTNLLANQVTITIFGAKDLNYPLKTDCLSYLVN